MNIRAKQLASLDVTRMDITTALGFLGQIKDIVVANTALTDVLSTVWTAFSTALQEFDVAYAQVRKWMQTADLEELDKQRDTALSAFLNALKAMLASPNQTKQTAARYLGFIRDKYTLLSSDEYMKETTAIAQMVQEMEGDTQAMEALTATGLDDWLADLKAKNEAFLAKMNERTEAQAGLQKGIVREKRLAVEACYRDVLKLINALAIVEYPAGINYGTPIDRLNAEIEHYRQILARKGGGSGGSGNSQQGGTTENGGTEQGGTTENGGTEQGGTEQGGGTENGGGDNGGNGQLIDDPELDDNNGGQNGGGSNDNGGGGTLIDDPDAD